ncbi:sacsin N-terminal ATP-binding-like domain-containing protein [Hydrogenophaga sp. XSHU_21]
MTNDIPELPATPRAVIEYIRRFEFGIGASLQGDGRVIVANTQRRYQNLLGTVAEDLNSKQSHFILELVQNADDNKYAKGVDPSLSFIAERQRLVVVNNETGFLPEHVAALCSAGESSKKNKTGYIGEKGIGFKSVFKVTDAPEVHSNGFHFQFNRTDPENVLGYVVPHWKEPDFSLDNEVTTLVLPARPGQEFPAELLKDLEPSLLLFLGKLKKLEVKTGAEHVQYFRKDRGAVTTLTTDCRRSDGSTTHAERSFFRTSATYDMSSISEPKRKGVLESDIVLALPLSDNGEAAPDPTSPVYAFLPIRDFNFPFCIQADFVLTSSRESVHEDLEWNVTLRDQIALCFVEALEAFKTKPSLANTYLRFLPKEGTVHDPFFRPVVGHLVEVLRETESVPVEGGRWRKPNQVLIASPDARTLFSSSDAHLLFGAEYPSPSFEATNEQLTRIGCRALTVEDVVGVFGEHAAWFARKPLEWKARFFAYLAAPVRRSGFVKALKEVACIPKSGGQYVLPKGETIFFPLGKGGKSKYKFEHELTVLDDELYNAALAESLEVKALFEGLGVKPDNPYALIRDHILKRHSFEELGDDHDALIGHVRYIRDKLDLYLEHAASQGQTRQGALDALKDGLFLGTNQVDGSWLFDRPAHLYLSQAYRPAFDIERMLGSQIEPARLVSDAYLVRKRGASTEDVERELASWQRFFYDIGVNDSPLLSARESRAECSRELKALLSSSDIGVRRETLECLDRNWHKYEDSLTYSVRVGRQYYSYYTPFRTDLRATLAPTKRKTTVPLPQAYLDDPTIKSVLGESAVFVDAHLGNSRFLDATGITYKVDASACLKRLAQIRDNKGGASRDQVRAIYRQLETLWSAERSTIEKAFSEQPLIMVGAGKSTSWVRPKDACWQPTKVKFLDVAHVPLSSQYPEHRTFFTKQLDVPLELPLSRWVDALSALSDVEDLSVRKSFALTIYRRLNRELGPELRNAPDWLHRFWNEPLFMDHRGTLVRKSDSLFANDDPEYAQLFEDEESISLLAVSHDQLPGIAHLLARTDISRVSAALSVEPAGEVVGEVEPALTKKVQELFGFIARVVYSQSHERFETAVKEQLFEHLRALKILVVPELELDVTLGNAKRTTSGDAAPRDRQLLLRMDAPSHIDHVAMEVRRILRLPQSQVAPIGILLRSTNLKDAEDYLRVTHVSRLPSEEQELLDGLELRNPAPAVELETEEEERADTSAAAEQQDEAQREPSDEGATTAESEEAATVGGVPQSDDEVDITEPKVGTARPPGAGGDALRPSRRTEYIIPSFTNSQGLATASTPLSAEPASSRTDLDISNLPPNGRRAANASPERGPDPAGEAGSNRNGDQVNGVATPTAATANGNDGMSGAGAGSDNATHPRARPFQPGASRSSEAGGSASHQQQAASARRTTERTKSGRLLSYTEPVKAGGAAHDDEDSTRPEVRERRAAIEKAAVDYFVEAASSRWRKVTVIPNPTNPGFDIQAIAHDGIAEFIEVKGQSGAWTETGVAVSPTQIRKAEEQRERFWLCVVEYATDTERRQLYLINNPFGITDQFRFDKGWKGAALVVAARPTHPKVGLFVTLAGEGKARITGVKGNGRLVKIDYQFLVDGQKRFNKVFQPNAMALSVD